MKSRWEDAAEIMDDPNCDPLLLERTYERFPVVNRFIGGWGKIYQRLLKPMLAQSLQPRLLDIGCGGGDIAIDLTRRALADGIDISTVGIDPDSRAVEFARRAAAELNLSTQAIDFQETDSAQLRDTGAEFDVVISNHLMHHLDDAQLNAVVEDSLALSRGIVVHADIRRSALASALFGIASLPLAPGSLIRKDGLMSIRRSYTPLELASRVGPGWEIHTTAPFRLLLMAKAESTCRK